MRYFILFFSFLTCIQLNAQQPMKRVQSSVYEGDNIVEFVYRNKQVDAVKDTSKTYFYFSKGRLHDNQGTIAGYYLTKSYKVRDKNGDLLEKGSFKRGLKHGQWMYYDNSGVIIRQEHWKNGVIVTKKECKYFLKLNFFGKKEKSDEIEG